MFKKLVISSIVSFNSIIAAQADEETIDPRYKLYELQKQQSLEQSYLIMQILNDQEKVKPLLSSTCLPAPLPNTPRTPNYSTNFTDPDGTAKLEFWREPCKDGTGSALLVKATPVTGNAFFCGASASVIQNGFQFTAISFETGTNHEISWCANLYVDTTVIVNPILQGTFYPANALTFIYTPIGGSNVTLTIPSATPSVPSISGSAVGYKKYSFTCKNISTGVTKTFASQTSTAWSCKGLVIKSGNNIQTTITGTAN